MLKNYPLQAVYIISNMPLIQLDFFVFLIVFFVFVTANV